MSSGGRGGSWANVAGGSAGQPSARGRPRSRITNPIKLGESNLGVRSGNPAALQTFQGQVKVTHEVAGVPPTATTAWGKPTIVVPTIQLDPAADPKNSVWGKKPGSSLASDKNAEAEKNVNGLSHEQKEKEQTVAQQNSNASPPPSDSNGIKKNVNGLSHEQKETEQTVAQQNSNASPPPSDSNGIKKNVNGFSTASAHKLADQTIPQQGPMPLQSKEIVAGQVLAPPPPNFWAARAKMGSLNINAPSFSPVTDTLGTGKGQIQNYPNSTEAPSTVGTTYQEVSPPVKPEHLTVVKEVNPKLHMLGLAEDDPNRVRPMRRKGTAVSGKEISVIANHFSVNLKNIPPKVYHYDVVITPKEGKGKEAAKQALEESETTVPDRLLPVVWKYFEERFHSRLGARMPFDGKKNCYTAKPLRLGMSVWADEITMIDPDDGDKNRAFRIQLKLANEIKTEIMWAYLKSCDTWERCELPQEVIQALDVALRYRPMNQYTPCNRSFFSSLKPYIISDLLELWYGHNQSLLLGRDGNATLNIDMANKAFVKQMPVVKLMKIILNKDEKCMDLCHWNDKQFRDAENFIKGKLIQYGSGGQLPDGSYKKQHRFIAVKIVKTDADTFTFPMNDKMISIREHFLEKEVHIKHPKWPVVHIGNKNMTNYVPIELCDILPQAYKGKLEAEDTSKMIRGAATEPADRFRRIENSRRGCGFETCPALKEFGLQVSSEMIQINSARKLQPPQIMYKNDKGMVQSQAPVHDDGKFTIGQFLKGAKVAKIGILNACGKNAPDFIRKIHEFARALGREAEVRGMQPIGSCTSVNMAFADAQVESVQARTVRGSNTYNLRVQEKLKELKNKNCQIVLVIMSRDGKEYSVVKIEAEVQVGVLTQCIREETITKVVNKPGQARQILINVLLKMNAKLNGISFQLAPTITNQFGFQKDPILFLGADVTHPAPNSKSPSVAAITASYDISGICYSMHIQVQPAAQEHIEKLVEVIKRMICEFRDKTHVLPKRVMMFRDGVSEGQFPQIKDVEYRGIKEACRLVQENYDPKITFLIVKKRHHTRFRPVNQRDAVRPKFNIPPGTVVDTVITHPTEMEFFLNSHVGIQGTSKPTRYHVLHDDSNFTMDELERLTYYLCYTFVRCTHPVSVPCVTYYAHIAAFRARALLEKESDNADLKKLQEKMTVKPDLLLKYPMFYV